MDVYRASGGMHQRWWAARLAVSRWPGARRWLSWREAALARRERDWLQRAGRLVANAPMNVADLRRNTAPGGPPISLIRNGVDAARFCTDPGARERWRAHLGVPQGGRLVLFAGHGWRRKNADVAWRAFVRVAMPADRLVLAGYEANAARVLRPARRALGERLVHVGPVSDMPGLLAASDVVLHPTWYDPAANIVLEAQACGVPVITTIADGNAERVALPELVVRQPGDVGEVAAALRVALGVEAAGRLACRTLAGAWPSSRMVDDWETLLQEHVDGR